MAVTNDVIPSPETSLDEDQLLTSAEVADLCRVTTSTVARWAKSGILPARRLGPKVLRFRRSDVNALIGDPG